MKGKFPQWQYQPKGAPMNPTLFVANAVAINLAVAVAVCSGMYFWVSMTRYPGYVPKKKS